VSCRGFLADDATAVAVRVISPPDSVAVGDTLPVTVEALNRSGDVIPGAAVYLVSLTPDTLGVDSAGLRVFGLMPGPGEAQAGVQNLRSAPFRIVVHTP
jgi:hypothetical protein